MEYKNFKIEFFDDEFLIFDKDDNEHYLPHSELFTLEEAKAAIDSGQLEAIGFFNGMLDMDLFQ